MRIPTVLGLALAGAILSMQPTKAQEPQPKTEVKAVVAIPYRGDIASMDAGAKTFTLKGKIKDRVFAVTPATRLLKDGNPGNWEDLKVGEAVRGSAIKKDDGRYEAMSVKLGAKNAGSAQPKTE